MFKYTPKQLKGNVNVSARSPVWEFCLLLGGLLAGIWIVYVSLGLLLNFIVPRIPPQFEQSLGSLYSKQFNFPEIAVTDTRLQELLDDLLWQLSENQKSYKVYVLNQNRLNALALPGNNIVVFSALIDKIDSENELAFVLAHELGHFVHKDHLRALGRGLVFGLISSIVFGTDSAATDFIMASLAGVESRFSQKQETFADLFALELINREYSHVAGALDFLEKISVQENLAENSFWYYCSTHPHPEKRIERLEKEIREKGYLIGEKIPFAADSAD